MEVCHTTLLSISSVEFSDLRPFYHHSPKELAVTSQANLKFVFK